MAIYSRHNSHCDIRGFNRNSARKFHFANRSAIKQKLTCRIRQNWRSRGLLFSRGCSGGGVGDG